MIHPFIIFTTNENTKNQLIAHLFIILFIVSLSLSSSSPSSPSHSHSHAHAAPAPPGLGMGLGGIGGGSKDAGLGGFGVVRNGQPLFGPSLSWLQNLPRGRKPKFSPWEDEETKELEAGSGGQ